MARPRGHSRKEAGKDSLEKAIFGDAWTKAPETVRNIATACGALRESAEDVLADLLPAPSGNDPLKRIDHANLASLIRLCTTAARTGNTEPIRQLAACLDGVHRSNHGQMPDPLRLVLDIAWGQSSNYQQKPEGIGSFPFTRPALLRWIRANFRHLGLGNCTEKRLREALTAYQFECLPAPKGGKRIGAGRKPIEVFAQKRKRA